MQSRKDKIIEELNRFTKLSKPEQDSIVEELLANKDKILIEVIGRGKLEPLFEAYEEHADILTISTFNESYPDAGAAFIEKILSEPKRLCALIGDCYSLDFAIHIMPEYKDRIKEIFFNTVHSNDESFITLIPNFKMLNAVINLFPAEKSELLTKLLTNSKIFCSLINKDNLTEALNRLPFEVEFQIQLNFGVLNNKVNIEALLDILNNKNDLILLQRLSYLLDSHLKPSNKIDEDIYYKLIDLRYFITKLISSFNPESGAHIMKQYGIFSINTVSSVHKNQMAPQHHNIYFSPKESEEESKYEHVG